MNNSHTFHQDVLDLPPTIDDADAGESFDVDAEVVSYDRSPLDLLRLVAWATTALTVTLATRYLHAGMDGIESGLSSLLTINVSAVRVTLDVLLLAASVTASLVVLIIPLLTKRWRLFGYVMAASILVSFAIAAISAWVGNLDPVVHAESAKSASVVLDTSTDVVATAQMIAGFVAVAPFVSGRWRHLGMWLVGTIMVLRLAVAPGVSTHALLSLTTGVAIGSGVLLMFGRPTTQPRASSIIDSLVSSGLAAVSIERASVDARGSVPWFARTADGSRLFVKVLGTDQRAADLLFRVYRMLRLRNVGDERPFSSLRRTIEHEALVALAARDVGVNTPRLRSMSMIGQESFLLAYDRIDGRSLDAVDAHELTDEVLTSIWNEVRVMREHRIAHRDLRLANVFLTGQDEPLIIDFGFSEIAADDALLQADLAQLLVSLSLVVGVRRATATAIEVLGSSTVADTLGRMQPAAMSGATQASLKTRKGLLDELRVEIEALSNTEPPTLEPVTRVTPLAVGALVVMVSLVYVLAPVLADLPGLIGELSGVDPWWTIPAIVATAAGFIAGAVQMLGTVESRLPVGPTLAAQTATAFTGKFKPAGVGAASVERRYLQRQGIDARSATQAIGLRQLTTAVSYVVLSTVFVLWWTRSDDPDTLKSPSALLAGLAVAVGLGAIVMVIPATRRAVARTSLPLARNATAGVRAALSTPGRLSWVFLGAAARRLLGALAFYYTTQAFGVGDKLVSIMTIYLICSAIAALAPTPGGLGAVEIALIGGLVSLGVTAAVAVPTVFLYRLITFWLPTIPGWAAFRWLRRSEML